jgi:hypothetical protein
VLVRLQFLWVADPSKQAVGDDPVVSVREDGVLHGRSDEGRQKSVVGACEVVDIHGPGIHSALLMPGTLLPMFTPLEL